MNKLQVKNLYCGYGNKTVIKGISFEVCSGDKLVILGKNGCGKSTLLKALCGLIDYKGEIKVKGLELGELTSKQRGRRIAMLSQFADAPFDFTVRECVAMARYAYGGPFGKSDEDSHAVEESMRFTNVEDLADRSLAELSGGQLQRVFLARVIAQQPDILLLDEPLNHLDLSAQRHLIKRIERWTKHRCALGVFHDISAALNFADKVMLMKDGEIIDFCRADNLHCDLLNKTYDMDVAGYLRELSERWTEV